MVFYYYNIGTNVWSGNWLLRPIGIFVFALGPSQGQTVVSLALTPVVKSLVLILVATPIRVFHLGATLASTV